MADQFMSRINGRDTQVNPIKTSSGSAQAGKIPKTNDDGYLDASLMPPEVLSTNIKMILASEAIAAGKYVNIYDDAGVTKCRLADATNDRPAHGFVRDAFASLAQAKVVFEGKNDDLTALVAGTRIFLGAAGGVTATPPEAPTNKISQLIGVAISSTEVDTDIEDAVVLAAP